MSHHPARRARTTTAIVSVAAFAGLTTGLAVEHHASAHAAPSSSPAPTTPTTVEPSSGPVAQVPGPDGTDWSGTPAPSGSLNQGGDQGFARGNHGQSGGS
jgi:hypothetical protein